MLTVTNLGTGSDQFFDLDYVVVSRYTVGSANNTYVAGASSTGSVSVTGAKSNNSQSGMIIGLVVGVLIFVALLGFGLWWYIRKYLREVKRRGGSARALKEIEAGEVDAGDLSDIPANQLVVNPFRDPLHVNSTG
jgi:hypothetical protein